MAETPRIRNLSRQDVIRTAVPRAFTGGSPERGIITSQSEPFSKAIDNLVEAGVPLSAKLHKEYREEEINKGKSVNHTSQEWNIYDNCDYNIYGI